MRVYHLGTFCMFVLLRRRMTVIVAYDSYVGSEVKGVYVHFIHRTVFFCYREWVCIRV